MPKYNIGFIKKKEYSSDYIVSCNCKTIKTLKSPSWSDIHNLNIECENCNNKNFVNLSNKNRVVYPYIEILHKDRRGFKAKRTNLSVFYDDDFNILTKRNMVQVLIYDLVNKDIKLNKNGVPIQVRKGNRIDEDTVRRFFASVDEVGFRESISTEETKSLYDFAWTELSSKGWGYQRRLWRGLIKVLEGYSYIQILSNAGFTNVKRFYERGYRYSGVTINKAGTNPREILRLPRFALKYFRENENLGIFEIKQIKQALEKVDGNRFREMMEIVKDESNISELCRSLDTIVEIHDKYNYNNIKKLTLYLFREIRMNQGIDSPSHGANLLRDYINMSVKLEQDFEKYPKSLKKEHDIVQMNYKVQESEIKKREFINTVEEEEYKRFEYKKRDYAIIAPKEMSDLTKEGNELSHCIASYVDAIASKRCKIFFLRDQVDIDKPLATIEVRGDNVRQARGYANRNLRQEERDFVKEWAEKRELELNYYY